MNILVSILTVADVIIALLLICLILVQQSKDSGFGSAFGGLGESVSEPKPAVIWPDSPSFSHLSS